jgi:hypothetical protein
MAANEKEILLAAFQMNCYENVQVQVQAEMWSSVA